MAWTTITDSTTAGTSDKTGWEHIGVISKDNTSGALYVGNFTFTPHIKPFGSKINIDYSNKERNEVTMRGLYRVFIVDPEADELVYQSPYPFVAKDEDSAERRAILAAGDVLDEAKMDSYDFIVVKLGEVSPKKEAKKVQVIEPGK